jgi:hypothetical protein
VSVAVFADDLDAMTICIGMTRDRFWQFVVKTGPATTAVELVVRTIQRCVATPTNERAFEFPVGIFSNERAFRSLVDNDVRLFLVERVIFAWLSTHVVFLSGKICSMPFKENHPSDVARVV